MLVAVMEEAVGSPSAGAVDVHVLRDALLKAGDGHEDFERGSRSELRLEGLVHQRVVRILDELVPVVAVDADGEGVWIEAGAGDHGENFAVARIHGDDGAVARTESEFGGVLQIFVDGELEVLAGSGVLGAEIADFAAMAVDDDVARPVLPAQ